MMQTETRIRKKELEDQLKRVGDFIRNQRQKAGLSQSKLAEISGVGANMNVARYENGKSRIPLENIEPIASALQCDVMELTKLVLPLYGLDYVARCMPKKSRKK